MCRGVQGVSRVVQRCSRCFRVYQGDSRGSKGFSGCFQRCTGVFRVFQGVSRGSEGFLHFFVSKTFLLLTFIAKRGKGYCKTRQLYWMILVLENEAKVISKRVDYYKTQQYTYPFTFFPLAVKLFLEIFICRCFHVPWLCAFQHRTKFQFEKICGTENVWWNAWPNFHGAGLHDVDMTRCSVRASSHAQN